MDYENIEEGPLTQPKGFRERFQGNLFFDPHPRIYLLILERGKERGRERERNNNA